MISFSFKREAKVYLVHYPSPQGERYVLDLSAIQFSQTFMEHSYSNKTLQIPNMFEQSVINKANPANFELTFPAIREPDLLPLFNRALDVDTFDLYVVVGGNVFKIANCVITRAGFIMERTRPLSVDISGEATRVTYEGKESEVTLPGEFQARSNTRTYNRVQFVNLILNSRPPVESLNSLTVELTNEIEWVPYTTVDDARAALDADSSMYPSEYVVKKKNLAGAFSTYALKEEEWAINATLFIQAGEKVGNTIYGFEFDIDNISFTNTLRTGDIFSQYFSWRMTQNPESLSEVIKYVGDITTAVAIQDSWDIDILDWQDDPLLESL